MTGMGGSMEAIMGQMGGMGQYGQTVDKSMLYNTLLQDSMFIESIGRTMAWDCIVYVNPWDESMRLYR